MDAETRTKIEETVLEILKESNMDETTEFKIRKSASEKLGMDLSDRPTKMFVRGIVESYLRSQQDQEKDDEDENEHQEKDEVENEDEDDNKAKDGKEYDDEGGLIICRLSDKRRVTLSEYRGKTLISIREYYSKDGKELPSSKGISLSPEQWASFKKNVPDIETAIEKMQSR